MRKENKKEREISRPFFAVYIRMALFLINSISQFRVLQIKGQQILTTNWND